MVSNPVHLSGSKLIHHRPTVEGAVLVGGNSVRFGSDKALFKVAGKPMARVIADVMYSARITKVFVVGNSQSTADVLGLAFVADSYPGEGPLGGLITALRATESEILCVLPCDVPGVKPDRVQELVEAVVGTEGFDGAILVTTREHWLCSSWRVSTCLPEFERRFAAGLRAIHLAVGALAIRRVAATESEMINVNTLQQGVEIESGGGTEFGE